MSNARKPGADANPYRSGYLRSREWFIRRDQWFETTKSTRCAVCLRNEKRPKQTFELHHISYDGVTQRPDGTWIAGEADDHLLPMHPLCHQQVHIVMDTDRALRHLMSRDEATKRAIRAVRRRLIAVLEAGLPLRKNTND